MYQNSEPPPKSVVRLAFWPVLIGPGGKTLKPSVVAVGPAIATREGTIPMSFMQIAWTETGKAPEFVTPMLTPAIPILQLPEDLSPALCPALLAPGMLDEFVQNRGTKVPLTVNGPPARFDAELLELEKDEGGEDEAEDELPVRVVRTLDVPLLLLLELTELLELEKDEGREDEGEDEFPVSVVPTLDVPLPLLLELITAS
jgi:hypothetical protein